MVGGSQITEAKLVDRRRAEGLRVAEHQNLRAALTQRIEAWNIRPTIRIGTVRGVVIDMPISGEQSKLSGVLIYADSAFVVSQSLLRGRRVKVRTSCYGI